jgi:hypothetical protein
MTHREFVAGLDFDLTKVTASWSFVVEQDIRLTIIEDFQVSLSAPTTTCKWERRSSRRPS